MSKSIVNELFAAHHSNRFHYEEDEAHLEPINTEVLTGWVCCCIISVAAWALIVWLGRWAWNHWDQVRAFFGI